MPAHQNHFVVRSNSKLAKRVKLMKMHFEDGVSVKKSAHVLRIPYSTAKYLVRVYKAFFPNAEPGSTTVTEE
jgi:hypothetical protein